MGVNFYFMVFVSSWCTLLGKRTCLHCKSSKKTGAIKLKRRSRDQPQQYPPISTHEQKNGV